MYWNATLLFVLILASKMIDPMLHGTVGNTRLLVDDRKTYLMTTGGKLTEARRLNLHVVKVLLLPQESF